MIAFDAIRQFTCMLHVHILFGEYVQITSYFDISIGFRTKGIILSIIHTDSWRGGGAVTTPLNSKFRYW